MMRNLLLTSLLAFGVAQSSLLFFVPKGSSSDLQCPDGSPCPDESTCCKLQSGHYGCCPQKNGVCCADQLHCCPNSFTCDLQHGTCVNAQSGESFGFEDVKIHGNTDHQPSKQAAPKKDDVDRNQCLDGLRCDDDQTCCPIGRGEYACCMFDQGVCCSDEVHCCPHGQKCDVQHEECVGDSFSVPWNDYARLRNMTKVRNVRCPDGSTCSGSSTCCPMGSSTYGCCPYQEAVCCSDKQHCCPHGFQCDVTHGQCKKGFVAMSWGTPEVSDVVCPDGSSCPGGTTCCELASGQYGCCPLPNVGLSSD